MRLSSRPIVTFLLASALAGCAGPLSRWGGGPARDPQAESLLRSGDYEGATRRYEYLARTSPYTDYYWLQAADAALRAGDGMAAQQLADAINPRELEGVDRNQYLLLASRLDLNAGRAREAMAKLDSLGGEPLQGGQKANYHTLRASAYNQLGDMLASARERVVLGNLLSQPEAVQKNNEAIYDALGRLPANVLASKQPPPPSVLGGWMDLTRILKTSSPGSLPAALNDWRARYPGHPADGAFLQSALEEAGSAVKITPLGQRTAAAPNAPQPSPASAGPAGASFVGVLLPLSGPYAPASQAIRSGLTAAYYADPDPAKPQLRFVDSQSGDVYQIYRQLVDQGARAVVGPLVKENVAALAQSTDLPVPVLALNQTPGTANPQVYQFGLTPEHEVEQAAGSAWFDGRQNALVLAPATQFGQRMTKHFERYWRTLGGRIAAVKTYPHHGQEFSAAVQGLIAALPSGSIQDAATDGSFIFLIADARDAHLILPQITSSQGGQIPVYATSHVYNGKADPQADQDLNGLIFCDIPWILNANDGSALSARALDAQIRQTPPDYVKLIALGLDAYRLLPELEQFRVNPQHRFPGATGTLSLESGNRVQRQLECAQFEGGNLRQRGIAPVLQPGASVPPAYP
jgi:outer membrane PBP1 activator LpoA protein